MTTDTCQSLPQKAAKLITCVLPDDGTDKKLMRALRSEKQVIRSYSIACRGIAVLQGAQSRRNQLPEPTLIRMVKVAVAEDGADALFDYIYETAEIGRKGRGAIYMGSLINITPFELPKDVPDEPMP